MGGGEREGLREARIVEIVAALLLGALVCVVPLTVVWLIGRLVAPPREPWGLVVDVAQPLAVVAGVLVVLAWLVRGRRRGL